MLETYTGPVLPPALLDDLTGVYAQVLSDPPWHEDTAAAQAFRQRVTTDAGRDGFRAVIARTGTRVDGIATGWLTRTPLRDERAYPRVVSQLGPDRTHLLLDKAFEVDDLAVVPTARGRGLGRRLLHLITQTAPQGRAWLLTARHATDTVAFYQRMGWREADPISRTTASARCGLRWGVPARGSSRCRNTPSLTVRVSTPYPMSAVTGHGQATLTPNKRHFPARAVKQASPSTPWPAATPAATSASTSHCTGGASKSACPGLKSASHTAAAGCVPRRRR